MNNKDDFLAMLMSAITEHASQTKCPKAEIQRETIPCPNCKTLLDKMIVKNKVSPNVGRPFAFCQQCCDEEKICFWFLDYGFCECGCPIFHAEAKQGKHAGRPFSACSRGCKGKFRWL